jgi:hypothetical protein
MILEFIAISGLLIYLKNINERSKNQNNDLKFKIQCLETRLNRLNK